MLASISWPLIRTAEIGQWSLRVHSLGIVAGVTLAYLWTKRRSADLGTWNERIAIALLIALGPGALVGARLGWVLQALERGERVSVRNVWSLDLIGVSTLGGVLVAGSVFVILMAWLGESLAGVIGAAAEGVMVGVATMRIADVAGGYHLGRSSDSWLAFQIPQGTDFTASGDCLNPGDVCHQPKLYELAVLLLCLLASSLSRRKGNSELFSGAIVLASYGLMRFLLVDSFAQRGGVFRPSVDKVGSLLVLAVGVALGVASRAKERAALVA